MSRVRVAIFVKRVANDDALDMLVPDYVPQGLQQADPVVLLGFIELCR